MSDESFLYLTYKRFLAVFLSVLPGLLMVIVFPAITMFVLDLVRAPLGWTLFGGFVVLSASFVGAVFAGLYIQDRMSPHEPHG